MSPLYLDSSSLGISFLGQNVGHVSISGLLNEGQLAAILDRTPDTFITHHLRCASSNSASDRFVTLGLTNLSGELM